MNLKILSRHHQPKSLQQNQKLNQTITESELQMKFRSIESRQLRMMMNQKRLQSIYYQNELLQGFDKNRKNKKCQSEMLQPQKIKLEKEVLKDEK